jgi:hypothetical protein
MLFRCRVAWDAEDGGDIDRLLDGVVSISSRTSAMLFPDPRGLGLVLGPT